MIESYHFGRIVIDGQTYSSDVIIYPDRVEADWWRIEGHSLHPDDLRHVVAARPDILVVGTGNSGLLRITPATETHLRAEGIQLVVQRTAQACRTYNQLAGAGRLRVVAALHLTC